MRKKEKSCPLCGYGIEDGQLPVDAWIEGEQYVYEWVCRECNGVFRQWYDLVWVENL